MVEEIAAHRLTFQLVLRVLFVACISEGGPQCITCLTSGELTPKPNANVHMTIRSWLSAVQKEDTMASVTVLCVGLVYMSTNRNGITFGAPTGSVNSLPSAIKNVS